MKVILKIIGPFLLFTMTVAVCAAQSALAKLPFDITIAATKNGEIENKGICVLKATGADSATHCIRYSMSDGKFYVYSNPEEVVIKVSFLASSHHVLPDNWKALGLRLASSYRYRKIKSVSETNSKTTENEGGNSQQEYIDIVTANGAQNITRRITYASDYQKGEIISFTIGKVRYDAEFIKWVKPKWCVDCPTYTDYDNGLVSIEVIESY